MCPAPCWSAGRCSARATGSPTPPPTACTRRRPWASSPPPPPGRRRSPPGRAARKTRLRPPRGGWTATRATPGTFGVAPYEAGVAAATINVGQQAGGSIGTSLLNTMVASATASYLASHLNPGTILAGRPSAALVQQSLVHGYTVGFWWTAGIFAAGAVVCGTLLRRGPPRPPPTPPAPPPAPHPLR